MILYILLTTILYQIFISIPLLLLGYVMIPLAVAFGAYTKTYDAAKAAKNENPDVYHFTWPIMFIWDNWEDGIANDMYYKAPNFFLQVMYWSCIRNPVNNLRASKLALHLDPKKIRYYGIPDKNGQYDTKEPHFFVAWQMPYGNVFWQFKVKDQVWRLWFGTAKIYPDDVNRTEFGYRQKGSGPVIQLKRVK